jgi:hypothetical protein
MTASNTPRRVPHVRLSVRGTREMGRSPHHCVTTGGKQLKKIVFVPRTLRRTRGTRLEQFRNYCGVKKIARCGFPWEKTTKRPVASVYTNCETARASLQQENHAG